MLGGIPAHKPHYTDARISSYQFLEEVGADEEHDPYYYGLSLIKRILKHPSQEIGTHTFSHFYCLEEGGDVEAFRADLQAAHAAAAAVGIRLASIVFPRNQSMPLIYRSVANSACAPSAAMNAFGFTGLAVSASRPLLCARPAWLTVICRSAAPMIMSRQSSKVW